MKGLCWGWFSSAEAPLRNWPPKWLDRSGPLLRMTSGMGKVPSWDRSGWWGHCNFLPATLANLNEHDAARRQVYLCKWEHVSLICGDSMRFIGAFWVKITHAVSVARVQISGPTAQRKNPEFGGLGVNKNSPEDKKPVWILLVVLAADQGRSRPQLHQGHISLTNVPNEGSHGHLRMIS